MSQIRPGRPRPIASWDDVADLLAESFEALDAADVFDIGPRADRVDDPNVEIPGAQAIALDGGLLLRLSTTPMGILPLRDHSVDNVTFDWWRRDKALDDCTFGFVVSADTEVLALGRVNWFRDKHRLSFTELGCELVEAVSLHAHPRGGEDDGCW